MSGGRRKNETREQVALRLAAGETFAAAAAACDVAESTVRRWYGHDAAFKERVDSLKDEIVGGAISRLSGAMAAAVDTLTALLSADSEAVRLGSARAILENAFRLRDQRTLEEEIRELQEAVARQQPRVVR